MNKRETLEEYVKINEAEIQRLNELHATRIGKLQRRVNDYNKELNEMLME